MSRVSERMTVLVVLASILGCQGAMDPDALSQTPEGEVDVTSIGDLYIWGSLEVDGMGAAEGRLDLVTLQVALLTECFDELVGEGVGPYEAGPIQDVCTDESYFALDLQDEDGCHTNICAQQIYICLGLKNQELAEAADIVEFETTPFELTGSSEIHPDGHFYFRIIFDESNPYQPHFDRVVSQHSYSIPPQNPANRTLLWRAATFAYREAVIRSVIASSWCMWSSSEGSPGEDDIVYHPAESQDTDGEPTSADLFTIGLAESLDRLADATSRCVENERSVAATLTGERRNTYEQVARHWQGQINSQASTLALLAGSSNIQAAREALQPVVVDGQRGPTRRAVDLLRAAAVEIGSERTDEEVMEDVVRVLDPTMADAGPAEIEEAVNRSIRRSETTWADVSLARRYMREETDALHRVITEVPDGGPGPAHFYGMQEPRHQIESDGLFAMVAGSQQNLLRAISQFDYDWIWDRTGTVSVFGNTRTGPYEEGEPYGTADTAQFYSTSTLSQDVELPPDTTSITLSVFHILWTPPSGSTLSLELSACGQWIEEDLPPTAMGNWERTHLTLELPTPCSGTATVSLNASSTYGAILVDLWGAQLERGTLVSAVRPGVDGQLWTGSRAYMEGGVLHAIDSARQRALDLLGYSGEGPCALAEDCEEYVSILEAAAHEGRVIASPYRYQASAWGSDTTYISVNGVEPGQSLMAVRGIDGLRCALHGTIDGAPCTNEQLNDFILARTDVTEGETGIRSIYNNAWMSFTSDTDGPVFVIAGDKVIGSHEDGPSRNWISLTVPSAAASTALESNTFMRRRDNTREPLNLACADMERDLVPSLENEITEDDDPYENSWNHYLLMAEQAAAEADALGQEYVNLNIEMDMRSEAARAEIAELCGASVDIGEDGWVEEGCDESSWHSCEERLATCGVSPSPTSPSYRLPYVSLGRSVCIIEHEVFGVCRCEDSYEDCEDGYVPGCPEIHTGGSCFGGYEGDDHHSVYVVEDALNLFRSFDLADEPEETPEIVCSELHDIRDDAYAGAAADSIVVRLDALGWIDQRHLETAARALRLEQAYPNYYALTMNGRVVASTFIGPGEAAELDPPNPPWANCPRIYPWRDVDDEEPDEVPDYIAWNTSHWTEDAHQGQMYVTNYHVRCASQPSEYSSCLEDYGEYTCAWREAFLEEGYGLDRQYWASHMAWALLNLEHLAGLRQTQNQVLTQHSDLICNRTDFEYEGGYGEDDLVALPIVTILFDDPAIRRGIFVDCADEYHWNSDQPPCNELARACGEAGADFLNCVEGPYLELRPPYRERHGSDNWDIPDNSIWGGQLLEMLAGNEPEPEFGCDNFGTPRVSAFPPMFTYTDAERRVCIRTYSYDSPYVQCSAGFATCTQVPGAGRAGLWNALEIACWVLEQGGASPSCPGMESFEIHSIRDVPLAQRALECAANEIHVNMERQVLAGIPRAVVDTFNRHGTESHYPAFGGEQLEAMLQIEWGLRRMRNAVEEISTQLQLASGDIEVFSATEELYSLEHEEEVAGLVYQMTTAAINMMRGYSSSVVSSVMNGIANAAEFAATALYVGRMRELSAETYDAQVRLALAQLAENMALRLQAIHDAGMEISNAYQDIQSGLAQVESIQYRTTQLLAQVTFRDSDSLGRAWSVNTAMRRRENTARVRYEFALRNAIRAAFLARRAVEFRLGVRMSEMEEDLPLVEAPSTWVDSLCSMDGMDYASIIDPDAFEEDDEYSSEYISDYVTRLRNFVESYPIEYPFSDSSDVTAISLRELLASQEETCESDDGPNLLYYSDQLNSSHTAVGDDDRVRVRGWMTNGCTADPEDESRVDACLDIIPNDPDGTWCDATFCSGMEYDPSDPPPPEEWPQVAERIRDNPTIDSRGPNALNSGFIVQSIESVDPGVYALSFWTRGTIEEPPDAGVRIVAKADAWSEEDEELLHVPVDVNPPGSGWSQHLYMFQIERERDVEVQIHPSFADSIATDPEAVFGDLWIGGGHVLDMATCGCASAEGCSYCYTTDVYLRTTHVRGGPVSCHDPRDLNFQLLFERTCEDLDGNACDPGVVDVCNCYREVSFDISLEQIEQGFLFQSEPLATQNFNYRHARVALNVQGSNVLFCGPDAPPSCSSSGFIPYTIEHTGTDLPVRNWEGDTVEFTLPHGRIQHGKALAAEVVVTNPLSGSQRTLLEDYWKPELRGRPLQGRYTLRIWETPSLNWWNVEDMQLILDYRYWTRFGGE